MEKIHRRPHLFELRLRSHLSVINGTCRHRLLCQFHLGLVERHLRWPDWPRDEEFSTRAVLGVSLIDRECGSLVGRPSIHQEGSFLCQRLSPETRPKGSTNNPFVQGSIQT
eukprot:Skav217435  [mRNA]  locus=scaffold1729:281157:285102:- [translate_table: standard]